MIQSDKQWPCEINKCLKMIEIGWCGCALLTTHKAITNITYDINNHITQKKYFPWNNHSVSPNDPGGTLSRAIAMKELKVLPFLLGTLLLFILDPASGFFPIFRPYSFRRRPSRPQNPIYVPADRVSKALIHLIIWFRGSKKEYCRVLTEWSALPTGEKKKTWWSSPTLTDLAENVVVTIIAAEDRNVFDD